MQYFENNNHIAIKDNGFTAVATCAPYMNKQKGELEIKIYRNGHKKDADAVCVKGGKLSPEARSNSLALLNSLLARVMEKWRHMVITFDCPDDRRVRVYAAMLRRHNINFNNAGTFF